MGKMNELYEKVAKDSALQDKFNSIVRDSEKESDDATGEKLTAFAREAGYEISLDEMKAFFTDLSEKDKEQLSDTELDMVAGGKSVNGILNIVGSVLMIGLACGIVSAAHEASHAMNSSNINCKGAFE